MSTHKPIYDVILAYAASEADWAADVERRFADEGLNAYRIVSADSSSLDDAREAHVQSRALILLIAPGAMPPLLMFEVGAATMGRKPAYALYKGPRPVGLPQYVERSGVYPAPDIARIVRVIAQPSNPVRRSRRHKLIKIRAQHATP